MKIDVTKIKKVLGQKFPIEFQQTMESVEINGEHIAFVTPVRVFGMITNTGAGLKVEAKIETTLKRACGRCLEEYSQPIEFPFELVYKSTHETAEVEENASEEEDFLFYEGNTIDLTDAVRESLLMAVPMKALCREDCRGFCAQCGSNLNQKECDCTSVQVDPRLQVLEKLLKS